MQLVQLLLPFTRSADPTNARLKAVLDELTTKFGGATAFVNSPAQGLWESDGERQTDCIITVEVMVDDFDANWWSDYRKTLELAFDQKEIVVRAIAARRV